MANELSVINKSEFLALGGMEQDEDLREAMMMFEESGETFGPEDITRVKIPSGGGTMWEIPGKGGMEEIRGVLVGYQKLHLLWPSEEAEEGTRPVLISLDGKIAYQDGEIPDDMLDTIMRFKLDGPGNRFDVSEEGGFPYNQWNTGRNGRGKRMKEKRLMFILRPEDLFPLSISAPPTSLDACKALAMAIMEARVPYYRAVVSLKLDGSGKNPDGKRFSRVVPQLVGRLSKEDGAVIKAKYTDHIMKNVRAFVEADVVDGDQ